MKKIIVCICLVLFIGTAYVQAFEFKHYSDPERGWEGDAGITHLIWDNTLWEKYKTKGKTDLEDNGKWLVFDVKKLSKKDQWLIWQALGEYDIDDEDIYQIIIEESDKEALSVFVRIKNNKQAFEWYAFSAYFQPKE